MDNQKLKNIFLKIKINRKLILFLMIIVLFVVGGISVYYLWFSQEKPTIKLLEKEGKERILEKFKKIEKKPIFREIKPSRQELLEGFPKEEK